MTVLAAIAFLWVPAYPAESSRPMDFVDIHERDPSIQVDILYSGPHNFIGRRIAGYGANRCLLTRPAAEALVRIQSRLKRFGLSLKLYDCYRPQTAVKYFERWASAAGDDAQRPQFYPRVPKEQLILLGYIASPSSHSRGSTVDATIVAVAPPFPRRPKLSCGAPDQAMLDMGTGFDCFDEIAHLHALGLTAEQRASRMLLQELFTAAGFKPYPKEWWHFTLKDEPFPNRYFDFPVR
jgi:D-alanyl-D-alanine dipeptidase